MDLKNYISNLSIPGLSGGNDDEDSEEPQVRQGASELDTGFGEICETSENIAQEANGLVKAVKEKDGGRFEDEITKKEDAEREKLKSGKELNEKTIGSFTDGISEAFTELKEAYEEGSLKDGAKAEEYASKLLSAKEDLFGPSNDDDVGLFTDALSYIENSKRVMVKLENDKPGIVSEYTSELEKKSGKLIETIGNYLDELEQVKEMTYNDANEEENYKVTSDEDIIEEGTENEKVKKFSEAEKSLASNFSKYAEKIKEEKEDFREYVDKHIDETDDLLKSFVDELSEKSGEEEYENIKEEINEVYREQHEEDVDLFGEDPLEFNSEDAYSDMGFNQGDA